jgi:hypothetical protein
MKEGVSDSGEGGGRGGPERERDGRPSRYYYDDATGYELFDPEEEEKEEDEEEGTDAGGGRGRP